MEEQIKQEFVAAMQRVTERWGGPAVVLEVVGGPDVIYRGLIDNEPPLRTPIDRAKAKWLRENQEEAERLIAGVLGLM
jgi:hypothetical protein